MKPRSTGGGRGPSRGAPRGTKKHRGARPAPREHDGPRAPRPDKHSLGGSQVEGRQAVRELLIARKRKAYEILISNEINGIHKLIFSNALQIDALGKQNDSDGVAHFSKNNNFALVLWRK